MKQLKGSAVCLTSSKCLLSKWEFTSSLFPVFWPQVLSLSNREHLSSILALGRKTPWLSGSKGSKLGNEKHTSPPLPEGSQNSMTLCKQTVELLNTVAQFDSRDPHLTFWSDSVPSLLWCKLGDWEKAGWVRLEKYFWIRLGHRRAAPTLNAELWLVQVCAPTDRDEGCHDGPTSRLSHHTLRRGWSLCPGCLRFLASCLGHLKMHDLLQKSSLGTPAEMTVIPSSCVHGRWPSFYCGISVCAWLTPHPVCKNCVWFIFISLTTGSGPGTRSTFTPYPTCLSPSFGLWNKHTTESMS